MYYFVDQNDLYHSDFFSSKEEIINQLKIDYKLYILFEYIPKQVSFNAFKTDYKFYKNNQEVVI